MMNYSNGGLNARHEKSIYSDHGANINTLKQSQHAENIPKIPNVNHQDSITELTSQVDFNSLHKNIGQSDINLNDYCQSDKN